MCRAKAGRIMPPTTRPPRSSPTHRRRHRPPPSPPRRKPQPSRRQSRRHQSGRGSRGRWPPPRSRPRARTRPPPPRRGRAAPGGGEGTSEEMAPAAEPSADEYAPAAPATESVGPEEAEAQLALAAEIAAAEAAQAESPQEEQPQFAEEQDATQMEGWVAPAEEPEPQGAGWMGEALEATAPLSRADLGALSSIGVDPNDGASALRLLAALVRVLNRHQLIDPEELAAEIRESRARGAGEVQEGENDLTAEPGAAATEPAET